MSEGYFFSHCSKGKNPSTTCIESWAYLQLPPHTHCESFKRATTFVRTRERYGLTFIGKGVALKMIDFGTTLAFLKKSETFWLEHNTSGIPDHLLGMISLLSDSTILASPQTDIFQVYRRGLEFLESGKVKELKVVSTTVGAPESDKLLNKLAADLGAHASRAYGRHAALQY